MMRREGKFAVWEGSGGGRYRRRGNRKGAGNGDPCQDYLVNIRLYRLSPKNKIYVNCLYNISLTHKNKYKTKLYFICSIIVISLLYKNLLM